MLDCLFILLVAHQDVGLGGEGTHVVSIHLKCLIDNGFGSKGVFLLKEDLSLDVVTVSMFGPLLDDDVGDAVGLIEAVHLNVAKCHIVPKRTVLWRHLCGHFVVFDGFGKLVEVDVSQPSQFVGVGIVRIAADGLCAVENGAGIIVKIELGHATKEVRLVEVWLVVDDNVEVTDGKHIVVVSQRVAGDVHHAVGVDLSMRNAP